MAIDVARLGISVDSRSARSASEDMRHLSKEGANAEKSIQRTGSAAMRAGRQIAGGSHNLRMFAMNASQVAQQGAATGDYFKAFTVQLADFALILGPAGILMGAAAGSALQLGASFIGIGEDAWSAEDALASFDLAMRSMQGSSEILRMDIQELRDEFGEMADEIRDLARLELATAIAKLNRDLQENLPDLRSALRDFTDLGMTEHLEISGLKAGLGIIQRELGVTEEQAMRLQDAFFFLSDAETFEDQRQALFFLNDELQKAGVSIWELPPALAQALSDASLVAIEMTRIHEAARQAGEEIRDMNTGVFLSPNDPGLLPPASRTRSRSGGRSRKPELSEAAREAQAILRATRTLEGYNKVLAELDKMLDEGEISMEQYTSAVEKLGQRYEDVTGAASEFRELNGLLEDGILDMAQNGVSAMDGLARAIQRAALEAALFGKGPLAGAFGGLFGGDGGLLGGALGGIGKIFSFDGGGHTGYGPRTGGLDGKGGFMAMLHPRERVYDETKGQGTSGGGDIDLDVKIYNAPPGNHRVQKSPDGRTIEVMLEDAVINTLTGPKGRKAMTQTFGVRPKSLGA